MSVVIPNFVLPPLLSGKPDLSRLILEVESVDMDLEAQKVRGQNASSYKMPATSQILSDFVALNKINLADDRGRLEFKKQLGVLKNKAPIIHMTFATATDPASLEQLVSWVRTNLHPWALISIGLQPDLIGGVYIRTPNHVHDFSLRTLFKGKTDVLVNDLAGLV